jgi:hypothetical protein
MANNKKSKTVKTKPAAVEVPAPVAGPRSKRLFTSAQFSGLVFLCVGISYLLEFRSVLESEKCQEYLQDYDDGECTGADMIMIRVKYHSGILAEALVALCVFLCWNDEALFHRLNAMLVSSPLITTLLALQTTKGMVHAGHSFKLCMLVTVLLMVAASSIYAANTRIASRVPVTMDLQNATLLTIAVAYAWEVYKFLSAGVGGFLQVSEVSQPSIALLPFLAVDQCTIVGICFFGIAFLNNDKKRVSQYTQHVDGVLW